MVDSKPWTLASQRRTMGKPSRRSSPCRRDAASTLSRGVGAAAAGPPISRSRRVGAMLDVTGSVRGRAEGRCGAGFAPNNGREGGASALMWWSRAAWFGRERRHDHSGDAPPADRRRLLPWHPSRPRLVDAPGAQNLRIRRVVTFGRRRRITDEMKRLAAPVVLAALLVLALLAASGEAPPRRARRRRTVSGRAFRPSARAPACSPTRSNMPCRSSGRGGSAVWRARRTR